jgi:CBS domain-containing protein
MTVGCILARKGRSVTTIQPDRTMRDLVDLLAAKHIGDVVIADADGTMHGIISERDVVRAVARHGCDALEDPVTDYMTRNVVTTDENESVIEAVQKMSTGRFRHLPVLADGRLAGMVSTGDAIKYRLEQMEQEQSALREYIATA